VEILKHLQKPCFVGRWWGIWNKVKCENMQSDETYNLNNALFFIVFE